MIQRIQSVYLLLVVVLVASMFSLSIYSAELVSAGTLIKSMHMSLDNVSLTVVNESGSVIMGAYTTAGIILAALLAIGSAMAIFMFRNRKRQLLAVRLNIALAFLLLILEVLMLMEGMDMMKGPGEVNSTYGFALVIPLICIILLFLAARGIRKDEALVRSADRLR